MASRKLPPPATRPATNTERGRAAKIRAKKRAGKRLKETERQFLRRYERARDIFSRRPTESRAGGRTKPKTSARQDAHRFARELAEWFAPGAAREQESETLRFATPGAVAIATSEIRWDEGVPVPDLDDIGTIPELAESGRSVGLRGLLERADGTTQWVTLNALTPDWDDAFGDFLDNAEDALEAYAADGVIAVSVIVR